MEEESWNP